MSEVARFYVDPGQIADGIAFLDSDAGKHARLVLRLREGDRVELFDGRGLQYRGRIAELSKSAFRVEVEGGAMGGAEPPIKVTLLQGIPRADKMDSVVQKCTELGINTIMPVHNERCVARVGPGSGKIQRWRKIAQEAARQCGRASIPRICEPAGLEQTLDALGPGGPEQLRLLAWEDEKSLALSRILANVSPDIREFVIMIGPEGGFTPDEVEFARREAGFVVTSLGPRILRTETAGPAVLGILMYAFGDLGGGGWG